MLGNNEIEGKDCMEVDKKDIIDMEIGDFDERPGSVTRLYAWQEKHPRTKEEYYGAIYDIDPYLGQNK